MIQPNFSESQLQQLVNTEITLNLFSTTKTYYPAIIISLPKEFLMGWDTAFYFPWLGKSGLATHRGCNFFIQYKLSELIEGPRGNEYKIWNEPYLRFHIPYHSKDPNGRWFYDYNQFDQLISLCKQGFSVYYATNHVIYVTELLGLACLQRLLNEIPFMRVESTMDHHSCATFTNSSNFFWLHSEPVKIDRTKGISIFTDYDRQQSTNLLDDIKLFFSILQEYETKFHLEGQFLINESFSRISDFPEDIRIRYQVIILSHFLRRYLSIHWFNTPVE